MMMGFTKKQKEVTLCVLTSTVQDLFRIFIQSNYVILKERFFELFISIIFSINILSPFSYHSLPPPPPLLSPLQLIDTLPNVFRVVMKKYNLAPGDFPDIRDFQEKLTEMDFTKFHSLKQKLIDDIEGVLGNDIPRLMEGWFVLLAFHILFHPIILLEHYFLITFRMLLHDIKHNISSNIVKMLLIITI